MIKISPSVLASDFSRLGEEAAKMEKCDADYLHLDVMDGHFVPNITFGAPVIKSIRKKTGLVFDVHLMISEPLKYIEDFAKAGADIITFHIESDSPAEETVDKILACGCKAGVSVKPATPAQELFPYLDKLSMALVMTVEPGFGGQKLMPDVLPKAAQLRAMGFTGDIEADGGINGDNAPQLAQVGIDTLVMGTAFFRAEEPEALVRRVHSL